MRILAIDPGPSCGYAHSAGKSGVWQLASSSEEFRGMKYVRLFEHLTEMERTHGIDLLIWEDATFGAKNQFNALRAHNEFAGVLLLFAGHHQLKVDTVHPTSLKKFATGNGRATKGDMIRAASERFLVDIRSDDHADALCVLWWCLHDKNLIERIEA